MCVWVWRFRLSGILCEGVEGLLLGVRVCGFGSPLTAAKLPCSGPIEGNQERVQAGFI